MTGLTALALVVTAGAIPASASDVETASGSPIRIGLLVSSEGPFANNSETAQRGAEYAVDKLNEAGGVNGHPLELVVADSRGQPDQLATIIP
ncbi:MAG: ABC transporter substrate-binding protein, partial [Actinomycetota bacterium]|nr:ABC transporter substrate-binding protein [Actinomycetota bacterium]